eukprot:432495-Pyramimonas_sp.AAC.1
MRLYPDFEAQTCDRWNLYRPREQEEDDERHVGPPPARRSRTNNHSLDDLPATHGEGAPEMQWAGPERHFCFVTDCEPLANVINGETVLLNPDLLPLFTRVSDKLFGLVENGWMTSQPELNPAQWRRRCFNRIADHIANYTMDIQRSWCQKFTPPVDNVSVQKANYVMHTDGGTRANKCSSSAWYVEAHVQLPSGT